MAETIANIDSRTIPVVDNTLSPHGGELVDRVVADTQRCRELAHGCGATLPIRGQIARELISIAYGFLSPVTGFMTQRELDSVCRSMTLPSGYVWTMPILLDVDAGELAQRGIAKGMDVLLEYHNLPMAVLHVEDVYEYDRPYLIRQTFGVEMGEHPGLQRMLQHKNRYVGGSIELINPPVFQPPFDRFFVTPKQMRGHAQQHRWKRLVAYHTRSVPHTGHEWLMKCAWFQHKAKAILVNAVIGEKRIGDCVDECTLLGHEALGEHGYFRSGTHAMSMLLWDTRYAGPKEAAFHAIVRKNMGATGHVFGRNHASLDGLYGKWQAQSIFHRLPELGIEPVLVREWVWCNHCDEVVYERLYGHVNEHESMVSKTVCSLLSHGVKPKPHLLREEVFTAIINAADTYGSGDGYVTDEYLQRRGPVFLLGKLD